MKFSRRTGLGAILASAAALGLPSWGKRALGATPASVGRIDTHHHFLPGFYVDAVGHDNIASITPDGVVPEWSAARAIEMMDRYQIAEGILSISAGHKTDLAKSQPLLRQCNEFAAKIRADHPGRFGSFASLPLPDAATSLKEIDFAFGALKADGVIIFTNYDGKYLGEPEFAEVFQELNHRKAVVFIHPTRPPYALSNLPPDAVIEFPFDTTRTAASLVFSGATQKYPDIKFILSHAGGTLPYLASRLTGAAMLKADIRQRVPDPMGEFRKFYYDTALSASKPSMLALMQVAAPDRILFGSDFPFAPEFAIKGNLESLDRIDISDEIRANINRGNAARLLGRS